MRAKNFHRHELSEGQREIDRKKATKCASNHDFYSLNRISIKLQYFHYLSLIEVFFRVAVEEYDSGTIARRFLTRHSPSRLMDRKKHIEFRIHHPLLSQRDPTNSTMCVWVMQTLFVSFSLYCRVHQDRFVSRTKKI
jgi:hypothetical protein